MSPIDLKIFEDSCNIVFLYQCFNFCFSFSIEVQTFPSPAECCFRKLGVHGQAHLSISPYILIISIPAIQIELALVGGAAIVIRGSQLFALAQVRIILRLLAEHSFFTVCVT